MSMRLVRNTEPNIKDFPHPNPKQAGIRLLPGINEVPEELIEWIENQENRGPNGEKLPPGNVPWMFYRKRGIIEYVELETNEGDKTSELSFDDLSELKSADAIKLVEGTNNMDALRAWQRTETRKGVGKAIDEKIAKMQPPKRTAD